MNTHKLCEDCIHHWKRDALKPGCGKGMVHQIDLAKARAEGGDCGPQGIYFVRNPGKIKLSLLTPERKDER